MNFAVYIISHERADRVETYKTLRDSGYTGQIYVVVDNEDSQLRVYQNRFGLDVLVFNKQIYINESDTLEIEHRRASALYVRNAVEFIAKESGYDAFVVMDDDITNLRFRWIEGSTYKSLRAFNLDYVLKWYCEYLCTCDIATLSFEHCMFYLGGVSDDKISNERWTYQIHFRNTKFPVDWISVINEDIITEISTAIRGYIWWSLPHVVFDAVAMNEENGGVKETYDSMSSYERAFLSVISQPSCCKVGYSHGKIRILQDKKSSYPMIIGSRYNK